MKSPSCVAGLCALLALGCSGINRLRPRDLVEVDFVVEPAGARQLDANLVMKAGTLDIVAGECPVLAAQVRHDTNRSKPFFDYKVDPAGKGVLRLRDTDPDRKSGFVSQWDVCITRTIPTTLDVSLGAGRSKLKLDGVQLRGMSITLGSGSVDLDLRDSILANTEVRVHGGAGELTLRLPANIPVKVKVRTDNPAANVAVDKLEISGLEGDKDTFVNKHWDGTAPGLEVSLALGAGRIAVETG